MVAPSVSGGTWERTVFQGVSAQLPTANPPPLVRTIASALDADRTAEAADE